VLVDVGSCLFIASRDFHLARRGFPYPCGSWVAVELNGTGLPSTFNPAELGALLPSLSRVSKLLIGMKLISLTYNPRTQQQPIKNRTAHHISELSKLVSLSRVK